MTTVCNKIQNNLEYKTPRNENRLSIFNDTKSPLRSVFNLSPPGLCEGAGVLVDDLLNATVGGKVMFTTTPQEPPVTIQAVLWTFNFNPIITFNNGQNTTTPGYEGRITLFISSGSLELRNLTLNDSGDYGVSIIGPDVQTPSGRTTLKIYGEHIFNSSNKCVFVSTKLCIFIDNRIC